MPTDAITALPTLAGLIEKLGVIGLLLIAVVWHVYERMRLMKANATCGRRLQRERLIGERYRGGLVAAGVAVPDISDILKLYEADKEE